MNESPEKLQAFPRLIEHSTCASTNMIRLHGCITKSGLLGLRADTQIKSACFGFANGKGRKRDTRPERVDEEERGSLLPGSGRSYSGSGGKTLVPD